VRKLRVAVAQVAVKILIMINNLRPLSAAPATTVSHLENYGPRVFNFASARGGGGGGGVE
jgi:hypothetical protein